MASSSQHDGYDPEEFYRTNDMAMVTYLKMSGHALQKILWESGTCYWLFRITENLLDLVEDYTSSRAKIEPREYNRVYGQTKKEFYDSAPENHLTRR